MEAKVERFARQTRGLHSRSEVFEGHLTAQAKELDACREAHDALREKCTSTLNASMSSLRTEIKQAVEQRHEVAIEVCHHGDRAIADELLKKMGELNEKLGANMLSLEEELAADFTKFRAELERQDKNQSEGFVDVRASLESTASQIEGRLVNLYAEWRERAEAHLSVESEHGGRLAELETKLAKVQEHILRLDGRVGVAEQASNTKFEQLREIVEETTEQIATSVVRVRSDVESNTRDAVRLSREEWRDDLRTVREESAKEMQGIRDDLRSNFTSCRDLVQAAKEETLAGAAELKGDFRTLCRDVCGMVEDVQQQVSKAHSETQARCDAADQQGKELEARITKQHLAIQEELEQSYRYANDQVVTLTETLSGAQQRLSEVSVNASRLQSKVEDGARHQASALAEVKHEAAHAVERQESSTKRHINETRDEFQRQVDAMRSELHEQCSRQQKDGEDLTHQLARIERNAEAQIVEMRDQLRERLCENAHEWTKLHAESQGKMEERLRHSDNGLNGLRGELAKALAAARDGRSEMEKMCQRFKDEVTHSQETRLAEALAALKDDSSITLADSLTEFRRELQSIRGNIADHMADSAGRTDQLANEVQRQHLSREELAHLLQELEIKLEERFNVISASTRQSLQESRQEVRHHVMRQLEEHCRPLSDQIAEIASEFRVAKRSERTSCERLQKTYSELAATQESLAQQCSATAQELMELRTERSHSKWRGDLSRDRSVEGFAFREDLQPRSDSLGHRREVPARVQASMNLSTKYDSDSSPRMGARFDNHDDLIRPARNLSQDRWSFAGPNRAKNRASFESVMGASPLRSRDGGDAFARRSRTPSPTPTFLGGRSGESWTFGTRTQGAQRLVDPLGSPLGKSPRSFGTAARGSYF